MYLVVLMQGLQKYKKSISFPSQTVTIGYKPFGMRTLICKPNEMFIRLSYENVKIMFDQEREFHKNPYYIARIQRRFITTKRRWFRAQYPHHRFILEDLDNANSIHAFNQFEEEGHVERFQYHFSLVDLARDALYALGTPTNQD